MTGSRGYFVKEGFVWDFLQRNMGAPSFVLIRLVWRQVRHRPTPTSIVYFERSDAMDLEYLFMAATSCSKPKGKHGLGLLILMESG